MNDCVYQLSVLFCSTDN